MSINVDAEKALQQFQAMSRKALDELERAIREEAEKIMTVSKRQTPVAPDGGTLRASGFVKAPVRRGSVFGSVGGGSKVTVEMGYGGAASDYALIQHEREDFHHTVGSAKYLERPVDAAKPGFGRRVGKNLERRLI